MDLGMRERLEVLVAHLVDAAVAELDQRWHTWKLDPLNPEAPEVVGGLLARQVRLLAGLASSPPLWNGDLGGVLLRAMYEVEIAVAWIIKSPDDRSRKYIEYGLGQEKLHLEHLKRLSAGRDEPVPEFMARMEAWLSSQRFPWFTVVNVGAWADIPVRRMAEEAGIKDLYDLNYAPMSAVAHSAWNLVGKHNLRRCDNPLHRHHRIPVVQTEELDISAVWEAVETLDRSFKYSDAWSAENSWAPAIDTFSREFGEMVDAITKKNESEGAT